jgi:Fe-S-cluster containining protein
MRKKLPILPSMKCDDFCGSCCGVVPASRGEYEAIVAFAKRKGITPLAQDHTCPWYQSGKCSVYEVRPTMCQVFGHVPELSCIKGYNRNVSGKIVKKMIEDSKAKKDHVLLHQALVDFGVTASIDEVLGKLSAFLQYVVRENHS